MKRIVTLVTLSLLVSVCGGEGSSNQVNEVVDEQPQATEDNSSVSENESNDNSSNEETNEKPSTKEENIKCDIFTNSEQIDPNDFFSELHDNFRDLEENSIYNYNFEVRNGPFILWQYEAAVELLKEIVPEDNFRTLNEFGNEITWEKYQNFTDALCETYTTGKNIRNVTITGASLVGHTELKAFAGNWDRFPYIETGQEVIASPSPSGLEYYTKYTSTSGVIIVGGENVPDKAMLAARRALEFQLSARPDFHPILEESNVRVSLFGGDPNEDSCVLPEYTDHCEPAGFAMMNTDVSYTANASWLCYEGNMDMGGDPVIHEMAHTLNHIVFEQIGELYFYENIFKLAVDGLESGDWETGNFALQEGVSKDDMIGEFFAISTERWFQNDQPDTKYGTRENIEKNNPALYELMSMYYPTESWSYCDT